MKISLKWLKTYIPNLNHSETKNIFNVLENIGFEVELIKYKYIKDLYNILEGKIIKIISSNEIDENIYTIYIKNTNKNINIYGYYSQCKLNDIVLVAFNNTTLPSGKIVNIKNNLSCAIICSYKDLDLLFPINKETNEIVILNNLITWKEDFVEDIILEVKLPYEKQNAFSLSYISIARELSTYYSIPYELPEVEDFKILNFYNEKLVNNNLKNSYINFYSLLYIENITVSESPFWLKKYLHNLEIKSINNIVDIVNWSIIESGFPFQVFTCENIEENIFLKKVNNKDKIFDINKKFYFNKSILVSSNKDKIISIPGIGLIEDNNINKNTKNIILEISFIKKISNIFNLDTELYYRSNKKSFEKYLIYSINRLLFLIKKLTGFKPIIKKFVVLKNSIFKEKKHYLIKINKNFFLKKIGIKFPIENILYIYKNLGYNFIKKINNNFFFESYNYDVKNKIDLLEEFIRFSKINNFIDISYINKKKNNIISNIEENILYESEIKIKNYLVYEGFFECYNYTLFSNNLIKFPENELITLENPINEEQKYLRNSLIPGLIYNLKYNQDRGNIITKIFEIGNIFKIINIDQVLELYCISFLLRTKNLNKHWIKPNIPNFYTLKTIALNILNLLNVKVSEYDYFKYNKYKIWEKNNSGQLGNLLELGYEINIGTINDNEIKNYNLNELIIGGEIYIYADKFLNIQNNLLKEKKYFQSFSSLPKSKKDINLIIDINVNYFDVYKKINNIIYKLKPKNFFIDNIEIFDVYFHKNSNFKNKKSLSFTIIFGALSKNIEDKEINNFINNIKLNIKKETPYIINEEK